MMKRVGPFIGAMALVGVAAVAARTSVWLKARTLGSHRQAVQHADAQAAWLRAQVWRMASPMELTGRLADDTHRLVAWSALADTAQTLYGAPKPQPGPVRVAHE